MTKILASAHLASGVRYEQHIRIGNHELVADEPEALGGTDAGPAPFGFVAAGLAACTAITLKMYAQNHGWTLEGLRVDVRIFADEEKRRAERLLTFPRETPPDQRARLAEIAEKTPVTRALRDGLAIETTIAEA
jgi:putative redox protein